MALNFPNASRCYDGSKPCVRFWGYDVALEVTFDVEEAALRRFHAITEPSEESMLAAFDAGRAQIEKAAVRVYSRRSCNYVRLTASDF